MNITDIYLTKQTDIDGQTRTSLEASAPASLLSVCLEELEEKIDFNFESLDVLGTLLPSLLNYCGRRQRGR